MKKVKDKVRITLAILLMVLAVMCTSCGGSRCMGSGVNSAELFDLHKVEGKVLSQDYCSIQLETKVDTMKICNVDKDFEVGLEITIIYKPQFTNRGTFLQNDFIRVAP